MRTMVVTVVAGRHDHLRRQLIGLAACSPAPDHHIVVSMGDPDIESIAQGCEQTVVTLDVPTVDRRPRLPVARARNIGALMAAELGADLVVFLDVDCVPAPQLLGRYASASESSGRALLCGPTTYLSPGALDAMQGDGSGVDLGALTSPHPARPDPPDGHLEVGENHDLFWSLSFATTPETFDLLGGFCEEYLGYGGEDTDVAATARAVGIPLVWVGGAHVYHQHHPVSSPPVEHLEDIVANARIFHRRHGRWPMAGWLDDFEAQGLITRLPDGVIELIRRNGE